MAIPVSEARNLYTKELVKVFAQRPRPTGFLRSFFPTVESTAKYISIEVQRAREKIAVDVTRGSNGTRNAFPKSTEKTYLPPYFKEYFDVTDLDVYDAMFGEGNTTISAAAFGNFIRTVADKMQLLMDKIDRAYEVMCASVLQSGVVTLKNGDSIDFLRKADSMVDLGASEYFAATGADPFASLAAAGSWMRTVGLAGGNIFNVIMGDQAITDFLANTKVLERQNLFNMSLDSISKPQMDALGAVYHGEVTGGQYRFRIWSYPQFYDLPATGVKTPYINEKNVIVLPNNPEFVMAYAGVPQLVNTTSGGSVVIKKGKFLNYDYIDEEETAHKFGTKSAGVPIPVAIDHIYTMKAVTGAL